MITDGLDNVRRSAGSRAGRKLGVVAGGLVAAGVALAVLNPFSMVQSGYAGVLQDFGSVQSTPLNPGLHLAIPFYQTIKMVSVQPQTYLSSEAAATHDQQEVHTQVAVTFNVPAADAPGFFTNFRTFLHFERRIIAPDVSADLKAVTTSYNAEELITKRQLVESNIKSLIKQSLAPYNISVEAVNIANFEFSKRYMKSIEDKQIAQQKALQANYKLQEVEVDAQQQVAKAKADAESRIAEAKGKAKATVIEAKATAAAYKIKSDAITPQILRLQAIQQWNGILPTYLGSGAPVPFLDSGKEAVASK